MPARFDDEYSKAFFSAVVSIENEDECRAFFEDICTIKELQSMISRLRVAEMLDDGRVYAEIAKETGASSATISRVNRALEYGSDGYKKMLEKTRAGKVKNK